MQYLGRENRMSVVMRILAVAVFSASIAACGSNMPTPSPSPSPSPSSRVTAAPSATSASDVRELLEGAGLLPAGRYTPSAFRPGVTFDVPDGWSVGAVGDGYVAINHALDGGQVVELLFANVAAVVDAAGEEIEAADAEAVAQLIREHPGLEVIGSSGSRMSGLDGVTIEVENAATARTQLLTTTSEPVGIEPGARLWLSLFDTADGLLGIAVASPGATWDEALAIAEPLLESVTVEAP